MRALYLRPLSLVPMDFIFVGYTSQNANFSRFVAFAPLRWKLLKMHLFLRALFMARREECDSRPSILCLLAGNGVCQLLTQRVLKKMQDKWRIAKAAL